MQRPSFCQYCPINNVTTGYVPLCPGFGNDLFVGEAAGEDEVAASKPFIGGAGAWLNSMLKAARISRSGINIVNCLGCRPADNTFPTEPTWPEAVEKFWDGEAEKLRKAHRFEDYEKALAELPTKVSSREEGRAGVDYCLHHHLWPAVNSRKWSKIVALGDKPLQYLTPRRGVTIWRGSALPLVGHLEEGPRVVPTLHPAYLMRNANLFSVAVGDLRRGAVVPPEKYELYPTLDDLKRFKSTEFSFDFEWDMETGEITLCGLSDRYYHCLVVPFCGPFIPELKRIFEAATLLIGHNIVGADTKYFDRLGWTVTATLHDTMLAQHLVQPDMEHGLGFVASVFTSKVFWKGKGGETEDENGNYIPTGAQWKTWDSPDAIPVRFGGYGGCASADEAYRLYNARDTDGSLQVHGPLWGALKRYQLDRTYRLVSVPLAYLCRDMAEAGLKVDHHKLAEISTELDTKIVEYEGRLPEGLKPYDQPVMRQVPAPPNTYKPKTKKCKGKKKDGTAHEVVEVLFNAPGDAPCPKCGTTLNSGPVATLKTIKVPGIERIQPWNSSPQVMAYADSIGCKPYISGKTGRATADKNARKTWGREHTEFALLDSLKKLSTQRTSFAKPGLLKTERVYFNLLVHGTAEGRLSSSGRRKGLDPNIQNQPKEIRKIFIPDYSGWGILDADVIQGENMLTAHLAQDHERMEQLMTPGFDEHSYMASAFFNRPFDLVKKGGAEEYLRAPGKVINHGRNYGLGAKKTQEYLAVQGFFYTLADITEMIEIWKKINRRTAAWQQETIEIAKRQSYLANPFGRRRWFQGRDYATKALAFLPASTLADAVFRMMIGLHPYRFPNEIAELGIQVTYDLPEPWTMRIQVHDSLVFMGPDETHLDLARGVKAVMTQPWPELDNFSLGIDFKYSTTSWGAAKNMKFEEPRQELRLAA